MLNMGMASSPVRVFSYSSYHPLLLRPCTAHQMQATKSDKIRPRVYVCALCGGTHRGALFYPEEKSLLWYVYTMPFPFSSNAPTLQLSAMKISHKQHFAFAFELFPVYLKHSCSQKKCRREANYFSPPFPHLLLNAGPSAPYRIG